MMNRPENHKNSKCGPVALLGNGPTLQRYALKKLSCPTIGINRSYGLIKSPYHCFVTASMVGELLCGNLHGCGMVVVPSRFMQKIDKQSKEWHQQFPGIIIPYTEMPKQKTFHFNLAQGSDATFGGYLAIVLAVFLGFETIYLLGYDEHNEEGHFNSSNTYCDYRESNHLPWYNLVFRWLETQDRVQIFNANADSAIRVFPFGSPYDS